MPPSPAEEVKAVQLTSVGPLGGALASELAASLSRRLGVPCYLGPAADLPPLLLPSGTWPGSVTVPTPPAS